MVPAPQSRKMHSVFFSWMTMRRKFCVNRWKIAADICIIFWFLRRS